MLLLLALKGIAKVLIGNEEKALQSAVLETDKLQQRNAEEVRAKGVYAITQHTISDDRM